MPTDQLFDLAPGAPADAPRSRALSDAESTEWERAVARLLNVARLFWIFAAIVAALTTTLACGMFAWALLTMFIAAPGTAKGRD